MPSMNQTGIHTNHVSTVHYYHVKVPLFWSFHQQIKKDNFKNQFINDVRKMLCQINFNCGKNEEESCFGLTAS